jgi:hypothetical protein
MQRSGTVYGTWEGKREVQVKFKQFTMTDRKFLIQDVEYWASSLDAMLQFYKECDVETEGGRIAKAIACGRLAGLGLAMTEHFSAGVESLIDTEHENDDLTATEDAGVRIYDMSETHTKRLEALAERNMN